MRALRILLVSLGLLTPTVALPSTSFANPAGRADALICEELFQPQGFSARRHLRRELKLRMFLSGYGVPRRRAQVAEPIAVIAEAPKPPEKTKTPAAIPPAPRPAKKTAGMGVDDFLRIYSLDDLISREPSATEDRYFVTIQGKRTVIIPHTLEMLRDTMLATREAPTADHPEMSAFDLRKWVEQAVELTEKHVVNLSSTYLPPIRTRPYRVIDYRSFELPLTSNPYFHGKWRKSFLKVRDRATLGARFDAASSLMKGPEEVDAIVADLRKQLEALAKDPDARLYTSTDGTRPIDRNKTQMIIDRADPFPDPNALSKVPSRLLVETAGFDPLTYHVVRMLLEERKNALSTGNTQFVGNMEKLGYTKDWLVEVLDSPLFDY